MIGMSAGVAGYKINAVPHAGNTSDVQFGSTFLAGRTAQTTQPLVDVRVSLPYGFSWSAYGEGVSTIVTPCLIEIFCIAFLGLRGNRKLGLFTDRAGDCRKSGLDFYCLTHP